MSVTLEHLSYRYDETVVVDDINLSIRSGELFGLLGPSGCGKTTTLRMIAGFLAPVSGRIEIDGRDVTRVPAEKRQIGMVFQNYALFPHMSVAENVGFGLVARGVSKEEQQRRIAAALSLVQLDDMARRPVPDLSGGQQQRVALARALVIEPTVLLLDEPLSNLDARLRMRTGVELRELQQRLRITTVYVTHDQSEALSLCDRIAVMRDGRVEQVGAPEDLYRAPVNRAVSDFLGRTNLLPVDTIERDGETWVATIGATRFRGATDVPSGTIRAMSVRPHSVRIVPADDTSENTAPATVVTRKFLGSDIDVVVDAQFGGEVGTRAINVLLRPDGSTSNISPGDTVRVHFPKDAVRVLTE